jgi:hypothetical protein
MKKITAIFLFLALHGLCAQEASINWSLSLTNGAEEGFPVSRPVEMKNGDVFSLHIKLEADASCYIIIQDSDRAVSVLHNARQSAGSETLLGPMQLTPPSGAETLFIIVSAGTQSALETKIAAFTADAGSRRAGRELLNEVFSLRREVSKLKENPEKPVAMGGAFRSSGKQTQGTGFSGSSVYVKTIVINH